MNEFQQIIVAFGAIFGGIPVLLGDDLELCPRGQEVTSNYSGAQEVTLNYFGGQEVTLNYFGGQEVTLNYVLLVKR